MKSMGQKIKLLRCSLGLSQEQLAEEIGVNVKSIQRYEAEKYRPDTYALARLAAFFSVSSDYLLGLIGYEDQMKEEEFKISSNRQYNKLYSRYLQCKNDDSFDSSAEYYFICSDNDTGTITTQTEWVGWANCEKTHEIRCIRPINPVLFRKASCWLYEPPMLINCREDVAVFLVFGGCAIVRTDICETYMPEFCREFVVSKEETLN